MHPLRLMIPAWFIVTLSQTMWVVWLVATSS